VANVRGCNLPDELLYDVDNHIWYREMPDGTVKLGMTVHLIEISEYFRQFLNEAAGAAVPAAQ